LHYLRHFLFGDHLRPIKKNGADNAILHSLRHFCS
jgi:hypothetical protein